jgi:ankyrin repeat protein
MPEDLLNFSPPWYASSPDIEPTGMSLDGNDQAEDSDTIEETRQLIDLVFPKDNVRCVKPVRLRLYSDDDLKARANIGHGKLVKVAKQGNLQLVESFLTTKVSINSTDSDGHSALHVPADMGQLEMVQRLLRALPNISAVDCMDGTALRAAAADGHLEVVKALLWAKANVNKMGRFQSRTALKVAAGRGHLIVVETLLDAGAMSMGSLDILHLFGPPRRKAMRTW